ncbi:hypothetical protein E2C01_088906 [Portunus trituberculatus]|uniref:Uncharacterized protein n=1 Tax=Portunus trituberculatus TaxID=210409 RepID=A0A5B7JN51_PORTR|nr:hypothetical protein [Portunus trituberculatus]
MKSPLASPESEFAPGCPTGLLLPAAAWSRGSTTPASRGSRLPGPLATGHEGPRDPRGGGASHL